MTQAFSACKKTKTSMQKQRDWRINSGLTQLETKEKGPRRKTLRKTVWIKGDSERGNCWRSFLLTPSFVKKKMVYVGFIYFFVRKVSYFVNLTWFCYQTYWNAFPPFFSLLQHTCTNQHKRISLIKMHMQILFYPFMKLSWT